MELNTPSLLWFLAGVVFFLLELSMPGFVLFFFAVGAWLTAVLSWLYPLSLNGQMLVFIVASLISLLMLRRFVKKAFSGRATGAGEDRVMAEPGVRVVVVSDIIPPAEGKVKYSGTTWRARADRKIEAGEVAEIIEQDGMIMQVKRVAEAEL